LVPPRRNCSLIYKVSSFYFRFSYLNRPVRISLFELDIQPKLGSGNFLFFSLPYYFFFPFFIDPPRRRFQICTSVFLPPSRRMGAFMAGVGPHLPSVSYVAFPIRFFFLVCSRLPSYNASPFPSFPPLLLFLTLPLSSPLPRFLSLNLNPPLLLGSLGRDRLTP